jgi:hypothetical protein
MDRVFAVEKQKSPSFHRAVEQVRGEQLLIIVVDGPINVTSVIFILESTVNDKSVVVVLVVLAVQNIKEGVPRNSGYAVILVLGEEMREHRVGSLFDIENGLQP